MSIRLCRATSQGTLPFTIKVTAPWYHVWHARQWQGAGPLDCHSSGSYHDCASHHWCTGHHCWLDVICIPPTAWVVEPVRKPCSLDRMGYKCNMWPLTINLNPMYLSYHDCPEARISVVWFGCMDDKWALMGQGRQMKKCFYAQALQFGSSQVTSIYWCQERVKGLWIVCSDGLHSSCYTEYNCYTTGMHLLYRFKQSWPTWPKTQGPRPLTGLNLAAWSHSRVKAHCHELWLDVLASTK